MQDLCFFYVLEIRLSWINKQAFIKICTSCHHTKICNISKKEHESDCKTFVYSRLVEGHLQDFNTLASYLQKFSDEQFLEAVSDFHVLIFIATMDMLPLRVSSIYVYYTHVKPNLYFLKFYCCV